jgi:GntR family transcriptional regulator
MANALYLTIVEDIKKRIISGELCPEDMLKSESELMKEYNVSRMTIRKSLSLLSNAGYIYSIPGKGNFIRKPDKDIYQFRFNEYDSLVAQVDEIKLLSVTIEQPDVHIIAQLQLHESNQVVRIERLIQSEHEPLALEIMYTPYISNKPVIEDQLSFANFERALEQKHSFSLKKEIEIKVVPVNQDIHKKLKLSENDFLFLITRRTLKVDTGTPLTYSRFFINKERFVLIAKTPEYDEAKKIF